MGYDDDLPAPGQTPPPALAPTSEQPGGGSENLERRVTRLESELAALRLQIQSGYSAPPAPAVPPPAPPPPVRSVQPILPSAPPPPRPVVAHPTPPPYPDFPLHASPSAPARPHGSFENRLGSQIFNRIGIVLLLIGTAWFLKYAVDRQWIGPIGRVAAGLLAGSGIVLWSERFRSKGFAAFSYSLKALGSGVLYLSLWAAFQIYHLLPAPVALVLMLLVTVWNAYMAATQNSELLAAYALAGGFVTPLLLSTGGNHETFLFTYLLVLDIAIVSLVRIKTWPRLLLGAWPLTVAFFIGWYTEFFVADALGLTTFFIVLFDCTFSSVAIRRTPLVLAPRPEQRTLPLTTLIEDIALPLGNAAFLSLSLYSVLQDSGHHALLPWLMLVLAAVYLAFMRLPQSRTASAIHLSIAVVFLTIAVPLKASGQWITVGWLVEGLALVWVATRLETSGPAEDAAEAYAARTLRWLGSAALVLGLGGIFVHSLDTVLTASIPLLNANTASALTGIVVFATAAWLALRLVPRQTPDKDSWAGIAMAAFVAIDLIALLLALREVLTAHSDAPHPAFQNPDFVTALLGLAVLAGVVGVSLRLSTAQPAAAFWTNSAVLSTIAFNLVAVLAGVREVAALWTISTHVSATNDEAILQQALAISAFLMLYGAALLAVGFWRRNAFLRWQGLLLLVFTIFKTFLYDMRNLSQGYRVASFLGLGALLMTVSFAYQRDWLALREPEATPRDHPEVAP